MEEEVWKVWMDNRGKGWGRSRGSLWEISNFGNVRRNGLLCQPRINCGYYEFGSNWSVHVAVATLFVPKLESNEKLEVGHKDGNPLNNRTDNLEWVTHKENCNHPITRKRKIEAQKGRPKSQDHKAKISGSLKGKRQGENNPMYNKRHSEESKAKMRGLHFYNNGIIEIKAYECPLGFQRGRLKKSIINIS